MKKMEEFEYLALNEDVNVLESSESCVKKDSKQNTVISWYKIYREDR